MSILSDSLSDAVKLVERAHDIVCVNDGLDHRLHKISDEHRDCMIGLIVIALLLDIRSRL
jgi:hypothetical protein